MQGGTGPVEAQVKWYNARKGFGFVLGPDGQDVFFHASALTEAGIEPPDTGDNLVCEIGTDRQGRRLVTRITELKRGEGGGAAGVGDRAAGPSATAAAAVSATARRGATSAVGGGGFGDRPPRRDFGGGGFGDRRRRVGGFGGGGRRRRLRRRRRRFRRGGGGFGAPRRAPSATAAAAPRLRDRDAGGPTYAVNGTVKWFDQVRGFGFVTPEDGGQDVFLHSSVLQRAGRQDVQQGEKVALEVRDGQRGRQAVNLKED